MSATALAAIRAEPHLSFSAIRTWLLCPRRYAYQYVLRLQPAHVSGALPFGAAIHQALEHLYRLIADGAQPTVDDLTACFADEWRRRWDEPLPILLDDGQSFDSLLDRGVAMLRVFFDKAPRPTRVLSIEEPFSVELIHPLHGPLPLKFVGVFDLVAEFDGPATVVEHKTAGRRWSDGRVATDLQLSAYSHAASLLGLGARVPIKLQVLTKTKEPDIDIRDTHRFGADHRELLDVVWGVHQAVEAGVAHPLRSWTCNSCPFADRCRSTS